MSKTVEIFDAGRILDPVTKVEIPSLDTNAGENYDLTTLTRTDLVTWLGRRNRPELENGAHTTTSAIGPVESCAPSP